jgi:hypothetical protein
MSEKNKGIVLVVLLAIAAVVWYAANRAPSTAVATSADSSLTYKPLAVENPRLLRDKITRNQHTEYKATGRDLFSELAPAPPPDPNKAVAPRQPQGPQQPPPPPPPALPVNMKFFGYGTIPNGTARRAFLSDGDQIYIVGEGDTLLGKYRVVKIGNANLDFEEIASGRRGTTSLTEEPAAAPAS